jgi:hypothetical protein
MSIQELLNSKESYTLEVTPEELHEFAQDVVRCCHEDLVNIIEGKNKDKVLTTSEAKQLLKRCDKTLWKWGKSGFLVPVKIGGKNYYRLSDINKALGINQESQH